jgi:hypothetical protein
MEIKTYNESKRVKKINTGNQYQIFDIGRKYNAPVLIGGDDLAKYANSFYGYCRVTHEIYEKCNAHTFYLIERFDGFKFIIPEERMGWLLYEVFCECIINAATDRKDGNPCVTITDKWDIPKRNYLPSIYDIRSCIVHSKNELLKQLLYDFDDIVIAKTKMLKADFENMIPKLKIAGIPYMMVELNTIATVKPNSKSIMLYTRQKDFSI